MHQRNVLLIILVLEQIKFVVELNGKLVTTDVQLADTVLHNALQILKVINNQVHMEKFIVIEKND